MALYPLQAGLYPLGQFDVVDGYQAALLGGEIGTIFAVSKSNATDKAAFDVKDGYDNTSSYKRIGVKPQIASSSVRPLWLLDEGTLHYGTLFGQVIGAPTGLSTSGSQLGPHTSAASGKVTCWDKPGLYAVSLDAVDTTSGGILYTSATMVPGTALDVMKNAGSYTGNGQITLTGQTGAAGVNIGRFVEFEVSPFLVTTPLSLLSATHTPTRVVISYGVL